LDLANVLNLPFFQSNGRPSKASKRHFYAQNLRQAVIPAWVSVSVSLAMASVQLYPGAMLF
jgi:hypothetical protein